MVPGALEFHPFQARLMGIASDWRPIKFERIIKGQLPPVVMAAEAHLQAHVGSDPNQMHLNLELIDTESKDVARGKFPLQAFDVPMPKNVQRVGTLGVQHYLQSKNPFDQHLIGRTLLVLTNQILAESHSRVSFALMSLHSCW